MQWARPGSISAQGHGGDTVLTETTEALKLSGSLLEEAMEGRLRFLWCRV